MNDANSAVKQAAIRELAAIPGFRGLEVEGNQLVVYVVSRSDEAALPRAIHGFRVRAVVAEKLREKRNRDADAEFAESGTYRIQKATQPLTRKAAG